MRFAALEDEHSEVIDKRLRKQVPKGAVCLLQLWGRVLDHDIGKKWTVFILAIQSPSEGVILDLKELSQLSA